jgi:hypothetical protein
MACQLEKQTYDEAKAAAKTAQNYMRAKSKEYEQAVKLCKARLKRSFMKEWKAHYDAEITYMRASKKALKAGQQYRECVNNSKR